MTLNAFPGAANPLALTLEAVQGVVDIVNNLLAGRMNIGIEFTPAAAATSTVIIDARITPNSHFLIEATSVAGAAELPTMVVESVNRGAGTCTVTHTAGAAGELFRLIVLS